MRRRRGRGERKQERREEEREEWRETGALLCKIIDVSLTAPMSSPV
jgi:hypothetical protein